MSFAEDYEQTLCGGSDELFVNSSPRITNDVESATNGSCGVSGESSGVGAVIDRSLWRQIRNGDCCLLLEPVEALPDWTGPTRAGRTFIVDGVYCTIVPPPETCDWHGLSPRESEIARMIAKGYANKTIATVLNISTWTVSTHLRRMFAKLHVSSRAELVARLLTDARFAGHRI